MPHINITKTFEEYDRMKNSVAVFRFFNQKIKVKLEEENGKTYFVMPREQIERTTFSKEQKKSIASILTPWYNEHLDKDIFNFLNDVSIRIEKTKAKKDQLNDLINKQQNDPQGEVEISTLDLFNLNNPSLSQDVDAITLLTALLQDYEKISNSAALDSSIINMSQLNRPATDESNNVAQIKDIFKVTTKNKNITKNLEESYEKLNEAFQTQMLGANLDDDDDNSSNALWLPVLKELINFSVSLAALGEAASDLYKTYKSINNFNFWLERELTNLYVLETELSRLKSTYKMVELKNNRDKKIKTITNIALIAADELLDKADSKQLMEWENKLFKGKSLDSIYQLPTNEYRKQLRSAMREYVEDEQPDESTQNQFIQLLVMLEMNHVERLITKKQEHIIARNNLAIYHINKDKHNQKISDEERDNKFSEIQATIDKYTNRNSISSIDSKRTFYNQLCEPLANYAWTLTHSDKIKWEIIKNEAMAPINAEHAINQRKLRARLSIAAGTVCTLAALALTATFGFGAFVILGAVILLVATIALIAIGERLLKDSFKESKNCISSIYAKHQESKKHDANKAYAENSAAISTNESNRPARVSNAGIFADNKTTNSTINQPNNGIVLDDGALDDPRTSLV